MNQLIEINLSIPEEILLSLRIESIEFAAQMKSLTALKLFEEGKLSIGQSAALADMSELDFIQFLGKNEISIFGTSEDITEDFRNA
jgi:predicted HTH domain antitoxin